MTAENTSPTAKRILVAGIGNIFFGDDAFGVEVVKAIKYMPEYGIVPHCKIGPKVVRAKFFSTVRIVCMSPPNDDIN